MLYLHDLKYMKLYKKKFYLPVNKEHIKTGSAVLLLTSDYQYSLKLMKHPLVINNRSFKAYYIEKDIMYTINNESHQLEINHLNNPSILNEQSFYKETVEDVRVYKNDDDIEINEYYCRMGDNVIFFNELYDESVFNENSKGLNTKYKRLLYNDRIRNNREVLAIYDNIKTSEKWINKTYIDYKKYKESNLFIDLYYYNKVYLGNNNFTMRKSVDMYLEFIRRFINDKRIENAGYTKKTVFVPVFGWGADNVDITDYNKELNPISVIYKKLRFSHLDLKGLDMDFVIFGEKGYFKINPAKCETIDHIKFRKFVLSLRNKENIDDSDEKSVSKDGITTSILSKLEKNKGIKVHNLTGGSTPEGQEPTEDDKLKDELVKKIQDASDNAQDEKEALIKLEEDDDIKKIISDLEMNADDNINMSATRLNRFNKNRDNLYKQKLDNMTIEEIINNGNKPKELEETALPIKTINDEWRHLKGINFEKTYNMQADILLCLNSLSDPNKEYPVSILSIDTEDVSTSEDSVILYTVKCEDSNGKRFTLKFLIPKLRDDRFMRLGGNEKIFSAELPLLPISKTDLHTVQIASLYNKILISRYYTSSGKSSPYVDRFLKSIKSYEGKSIRFYMGNNTNVNNKYELPIDYIDLGGTISKIEIKGKSPMVFYFNQDEIRNIAKDKINTTKGIPVGIKNDGTIVYFTDKDVDVVSVIIDHLTINGCNDFVDIYQNTKPGNKFTYSRANILNTSIPIIVILCHDLGLIKTLHLAGIKYNFTDKKQKDTPGMDSIKFADGYLNYDITYSSLMLMNGLKDCNTEDIEIASVNTKKTWVEQLDNFGGRIKSDGLDNFKDLMYDPITVEVSRDYNLPDNYHEALIYASNLLIDNKYVKHTDLSSNRYRTNEVIVAQLYKALTDSYKSYAYANKHGRSVGMTMRQDEVINLILAQNTTSDLSVFQPLMEIESKNTVSTKGVIGMNEERAYKLDRRGYTDSMINVIAQATGFAASTGVNRQITINPNIVGGRGYIKKASLDEMNVTNTLSVTESISPFVLVSDDPFRNNMTFTQTSKHSTPIEYGTPQLVTTGGDAAMPYLVSNMFCHKARFDGEVTQITDEYMIVEYKNGEKEYVDLTEQTKKNSDGGFYITLKLITDLKVGSKVKKNTILAYDSKSFSNRKGDHSQVEYNSGCLAKIAILTTEDGFEDSGVCSEWLSEAMASDIVIMKAVNLDPSTNILSIVKKGQKITEGDALLVFQNAYDEEDANLLLKSLNNEDGDVIEIGRNTIKSKVTGEISDIKIYRTVDKDQLSASLNKIVTSKERDINRLKKIANEASNDVQFDSTDKLQPTGKLKNLEGVRIEFYMRYHDKLSCGDKLSLTFANKIVLRSTYSNDQAPYTDFRPNEKVDVVGSASAIDGRMITSTMKLGSLNKVMIELTRSVCDIMGVPWKTIHETYDYYKGDKERIN